MPYCSRCGVEVDAYVQTCPLCRIPIQQSTVDADKEISKFPLTQKKELKDSLSRKQKRNLTWGIISLLIFIPIFVILAIRFLYTNFFTWEGYTLVPLAAGWIYFSLLLFFIKKIKIIMLGFFINTNVLLFFIDILDGKIHWYLKIGLPVLSLFFLLILGVVMLSIRTKRRGANIAAFIFTAIFLFCIGLELILSLNQTGEIVLKWSLIVTVALTPLVLFLFIIHYIMRVKLDWGKKFHV